MRAVCILPGESRRGRSQDGIFWEEPGIRLLAGIDFIVSLAGFARPSRLNRDPLAFTGIALARARTFRQMVFPPNDALDPARQ